MAYSVLPGVFAGCGHGACPACGPGDVCDRFVCNDGMLVRYVYRALPGNPIDLTLRHFTYDQRIRS